MDIDKLSLNQRNILGLFDKHQDLSVGKIAKELKIPRPTTKQSLNRLLEYNLVLRQGIGKGTFYLRKDENVVLDTLGNKLVMVYKGKEAFSKLFNSIHNLLKKKDFYWSFAFKDEYYDQETADFFFNFHRHLIDKGVEDRTIVHTSVIDIIKVTYQDIPELKIRATDQEIPIGMSILGNCVISLVWENKPVAIAIYSSSIIKRYHDFFLSVWEKSKPISSK